MVVSPFQHLRIPEKQEKADEAAVLFREMLKLVKSLHAQLGSSEPGNESDGKSISVAWLNYLVEQVNLKKHTVC
ncbi:hypothetical protein MUK42_36777 [Musa troglodytarum]|uniref:Uncharacterized protein n=1 Tax=Musa troglodytarum TaxID=320322 RepID=A0A9E7J8Z3_9LILI|nr:hypothetical protein MUK42_36777 [Musa troglodytarum]